MMMIFVKWRKGRREGGREGGREGRRNLSLPAPYIFLFIVRA
jgi:hypothetical protein